MKLVFATHNKNKAIEIQSLMPEGIEVLTLDEIGCTDRSAQFRTAIALRLNGETHLFEGIVSGTITAEKRGNDGFGYDPIFQPEGSQRTFAEMSLPEKNNMSHRARALEKMIDFIKRR